MSRTAEPISEEEARAFVILTEAGWATRKIARVMRRAEHTVSFHVNRQERELRAARQLRLTQAIRA